MFVCLCCRRNQCFCLFLLCMSCLQAQLNHLDRSLWSSLIRGSNTTLPHDCALTVRSESQAQCLLWKKSVLHLFLVYSHQIVWWKLIVGVGMLQQLVSSCFLLKMKKNKTSGGLWRNVWKTQSLCWLDMARCRCLLRPCWKWWRKQPQVLQVIRCYRGRGEERTFHNQILPRDWNSG